MVTHKELIKREKEYESQGIFDVHIDEPDLSLMIPVTEKFPYIKKGFLKLKIAFEKAFIVNPFTRHINKKVCKTKVIGKENLKGIKSCILTCNHVYIFDCLVATLAVKGHKIRITSAEFNNRSDKLGEYMRAGGLMPMSSNMKAMMNFNKAISYYLKHNNYVMFYPEQAMWWMYEKPRPLKNGAFHYAVKENVPVVPMFITFEGNGTFDEEGIENKNFIIHIGKPIYKKQNLSDKENIEYMKDQNYKSWVNTYEGFYGKKLKFNIKKKVK